MSMHLCRGRAVLCVLIAAAAGCASSPPARLYVLEPIEAPAVSIGSTSGPILIGSVLLPERLRRKEITEHRDRYRVESLEFDRWAEPLEVGVARVLAENLSLLLATNEVVTWPGAGAGDPLRIDLQIHEFGSSPGGAVVLQATWSLTAGENISPTMQIRHSESREDQSVESLVAAMSAGLEKLARDIAAAITTLEGRS